MRRSSAANPAPSCANYRSRPCEQVHIRVRIVPDTNAWSPTSPRTHLLSHLVWWQIGPHRSGACFVFTITAVVVFFTTYLCLEQNTRFAGRGGQQRRRVLVCILTPNPSYSPLGNSFVSRPEVAYCFTVVLLTSQSVPCSEASDSDTMNIPVRSEQFIWQC